MFKEGFLHAFEEWAPFILALFITAYVVVMTCFLIVYLASVSFGGIHHV